MIVRVYMKDRDNFITSRSENNNKNILIKIRHERDFKFIHLIQDLEGYLYRKFKHSEELYNEYNSTRRTYTLYCNTTKIRKIIIEGQ